MQDQEQTASSVYTRTEAFGQRVGAKESADVLEGDMQILEVITAYSEGIVKSLEEVQRALKDLGELVRRVLKNTNHVCYETSL